MLTQPVQKNLIPASKTSRGRRSSIRTKITFWAGLWLVFVSFVLIGYSIFALRNTAIDNATNEAVSISELRAGLVIDVLDPPLMKARALAEAFGAVKDASIPVTLSRDEANAMLRKVLLENPSFLGTYTLWEPNEFDGLDSEYVRAVAHDETGRFIPYWVRDLSGIIHTEALTQYEIPGVGDWYIVPRSTMKEIVIAPIVRHIQGQDITIASFIIPIESDGKFYGIAGVDAPIDVMQELVDSIDLYQGSTDVALFTEDGTLIAVRNRPEVANKSVDLIYNDYNQIQPQLSNTFSRLSQDGKYLQIFSPIEVDDAGTRWVLGLSIPFEKITAPATNAAIRQVVISLAFIALALVFLWFVAGQLVRPMQTLTNAAKAVSEGNLSVTAKVHSNDETEVLADAFNSMTLQLKNLFGSLEQRVESRTKALSDVAEISTAASTTQDVQEMLASVVHLTQRRFGLYHAHVFVFDEATEELKIVACGWKEGDEHEGTHGTTVIPIGQEQSLVARAARTRQAVIVNDVRSDPDWLPNPLLPDTASELAVPMLIGDQVVGVLDVQSDRLNAFTESDASIQTTLGSQVAVALQNARLYTQAEISRQEAQSLVDFAPEAIVIVDLETGLFTDPNENAEKLYGMPRQELVKVGPAQMSPPKQPDGRDSTGKAMEKINEAMQGKSVVFEWIHRNAQGEDITCEIRLVRLPGAHPRVRASVTDITERKRLEELTIQRARQQETLNLITQRIQNTTTVEAALQIAARELGHALGMKPTVVALDPATITGKE